MILQLVMSTGEVYGERSVRHEITFHRDMFGMCVCLPRHSRHRLPPKIFSASPGIFWSAFVFAGEALPISAGYSDPRDSVPPPLPHVRLIDFGCAHGRL